MGIALVSTNTLHGSIHRPADGNSLQEAQREEAKKQEAKEKAEMEGCPASECGPWPEEGGAEYELEDPPGLASYKKTLERAEQLRKDAVNGALIGLAADIGIPGAADGGAAYAAILEASAYSLELCVEAGRAVGGKAGKDGTCFINELRGKLLFINVPVEATAELCEYIGTKQWGKKSHNEYYCVDAGIVRTGPWY